MRSKLLIVVSVVFILALLTPAAFLDASAGSQIALLSAQFMDGRGLVLVFSFPIGYDTSGVDGVVLVDGASYPLKCSVNDSKNHLICGGVTKKHLGSSATVVIDGLAFETSLQEQTRWCYDVFDYGPGTIPWGVIGIWCENDSVAVGDQIHFYNPNYDNDYDYTYGAPHCAGAGNGYAYENC